MGMVGATLVGAATEEVITEGAIITEEVITDN
jgi:hypothetical protein